MAINDYDAKYPTSTQTVATPQPTSTTGVNSSSIAKTPSSTTSNVKNNINTKVYTPTAPAYTNSVTATTGTPNVSYVPTATSPTATSLAYTPTATASVAGMTPTTPAAYITPNVTFDVTPTTPGACMTPNVTFDVTPTTPGVPTTTPDSVFDSVTGQYITSTPDSAIINSYINKFVSGDLTITDTIKNLKSIGARDIKDISTADMKVITFVYNDVKQTIRCNAQAAEYANDGKRAKVEDAQYVQKYFIKSDIAKYFDVVQECDGKTMKYALKTEYSNKNIDSLAYEIFIKYRNDLILDNFLGDKNKKTNNYTELYKTQNGTVAVTNNYVQYAEEIGLATGDKADKLRQEALDKFVKDFSSGNLAYAQVADILKAIGVENKNTIYATKSNNYIYTISFTFNGKNYSVSCNRDAALKGNDYDNIQTYTPEDLRTLGANNEVINKYFDKVATQGDEAIMFKLKEGVSIEVVMQECKPEPIEIKSIDDLKNIKPGNNYKLTSNITLPDNWSGVEFYGGTFDAGGYKITTTFRYSNTTLFSSLGKDGEETKIKGLDYSLEFQAANSGINGGLVANTATGTTFEDCSVILLKPRTGRDKTINTYRYSGGFVGVADNCAFVKCNASLYEDAVYGAFAGKVVNGSIFNQCTYASTSENNLTFLVGQIGEEGKTSENSYLFVDCISDCDSSGSTNNVARYGYDRQNTIVMKRGEVYVPDPDTSETEANYISPSDASNAKMKHYEEIFFGYGKYREYLNAACENYGISEESEQYKSFDNLLKEYEDCKQRKSQANPEVFAYEQIIKILLLTNFGPNITQNAEKVTKIYVDTLNSNILTDSFTPDDFEELYSKWNEKISGAVNNDLINSGYFESCSEGLTNVLSNLLGDNYAISYTIDTMLFNIRNGLTCDDYLSSYTDLTPEKEEKIREIYAHVEAYAYEAIKYLEELITINDDGTYTISEENFRKYVEKYCSKSILDLPEEKFSKLLEEFINTLNPPASEETNNVKGMTRSNARAKSNDEIPTNLRGALAIVEPLANLTNIIPGVKSGDEIYYSLVEIGMDNDTAINFRDSYNLNKAGIISDTLNMIATVGDTYGKGILPPSLYVALSVMDVYTGALSFDISRADYHVTYDGILRGYEPATASFDNAMTWLSGSFAFWDFFSGLNELRDASNNIPLKAGTKDYIHSTAELLTSAYSIYSRVQKINAIEAYVRDQRMLAIAKDILKKDKIRNDEEYLAIVRAAAKEDMVIEPNIRTFESDGKTYRVATFIDKSKNSCGLFVYKSGNDKIYTMELTGLYMLNGQGFHQNFDSQGVYWVVGDNTPKGASASIPGNYMVYDGMKFGINRYGDIIMYPDDGVCHEGGVQVSSIQKTVTLNHRGHEVPCETIFQVDANGNLVTYQKTVQDMHNAMTGDKEQYIVEITTTQKGFYSDRTTVYKSIYEDKEITTNITSISGPYGTTTERKLVIVDKDGNTKEIIEESFTNSNGVTHQTTYNFKTGEYEYTTIDAEGNTTQTGVRPIQPVITVETWDNGSSFYTFEQGDVHFSERTWVDSETGISYSEYIDMSSGGKIVTKTNPFTGLVIKEYYQEDEYGEYYLVETKSEICKQIQPKIDDDSKSNGLKDDTDEWTKVEANVEAGSSAGGSSTITIVLELLYPEFSSLKWNNLTLETVHNLSVSLGYDSLNGINELYTYLKNNFSDESFEKLCENAHIISAVGQSSPDLAKIIAFAILKNPDIKLSLYVDNDGTKVRDRIHALEEQEEQLKQMRMNLESAMDSLDPGACGSLIDALNNSDATTEDLERAYSTALSATLHREEDMNAANESGRNRGVANKTDWLNDVPSVYRQAFENPNYYFQTTITQGYIKSAEDLIRYLRTNDYSSISQRLVEPYSSNIRKSLENIIAVQQAAYSMGYSIIENIDDAWSVLRS